MISVAIPIYNEEEILHLLHERVSSVMNGIGEPWEVVYVNDGSKDATFQLLLELQARDPHVVVVDLSRNFGHVGALTAGLQTARGDAVVIMDGDLQDPPEVIPEMVDAWRSGAQVVTTIRRSRKESRKHLALLFAAWYRVLGMMSEYPIPLNSGIFGLMDRKALDAFNALPEVNRYLPGVRAWIGYRTSIVYYDRDDRAGGEGKLNIASRIKYAWDAITGYSMKPIRFMTYAGAAAIMFGLLFAMVMLAFGGSSSHGTTAAVFFMGGVQLVCAGVLGEYIGRIYDQVRQRPLSLINHVYRSEAVSNREHEAEDAHIAA
ncbi:MAG: glycosyltransferase family 2 protein [Candidatus Korobacteraceae bacterium]